ncbi:hypothetical protein [Sediminitomix flava]|uniref:Uncharacterized protein n=1 Tax=Sediminitomix flava TaxID=379075 RepID=A0A315ZI32_SEDFL|nr:hypothetical protein [Sediminitomix flava]PWJ44873.1 hypothetical protein BC781_1011262 [Sediminitomix flava]
MIFKKKEKSNVKTILKFQGKGFPIVEGENNLSKKAKLRQKWIEGFFKFVVFPFELLQFGTDIYFMDYIGITEWGFVGGVSIFLFLRGKEDQAPFVKLDEEKFSYQFSPLERTKKIFFKDLKSVHLELENIVFYLKNGEKESFLINVNTVSYKEKMDLLKDKLIEQISSKEIKITLSPKKAKTFYEKHPELEGTLEIFDRYRKV